MSIENRATGSNLAIKRIITAAYLKQLALNFLGRIKLEVIEYTVIITINIAAQRSYYLSIKYNGRLEGLKYNLKFKINRKQKLKRTNKAL